MELEVSRLQSGYNGTVIIDGLDLRIPAGRITSLIGANGCGKSTLLKTICRILKPTAGTVFLDGVSVHGIDSKELARRLAILPQNPTAPDGLTVRELVGYGRAPHSSGLFSRISQKDRDIVQWAIEETDLAAFADRPVYAMSGGQRQRAWIAMAIAQDTDILFLDEPTSFLDVSHQMEVLHMVSSLNRKYGKTIVMVIHDLNEAARFSHHMVAMKRGQVRYNGTPHEIFTKKMLSDIFDIDADIMTNPRTGTPFCIPFLKDDRHETK